jgi:ATP-dependent Clp protease adaptor protein ClpS
MEPKSMSEQTVTVPRPERAEEVGNTESGWIVIVYDNPVNTFEQVIGILQKATGCSLEEAEMETWEVHHVGRSVVHHGDQAECERAASVIATIGIQVKVEQL